MPKIDLLVQTKIHLPSARPDLVVRTRLEKQIMQGLGGPLTLIIAPAGFGKTTLVSACAASCRMPVAWLSLDKNDNHIGRFLTYLIAALQEAEDTIVGEAAVLIAEMSQLSPEAVLTTLINDLDKSNTEIALVLDDYHSINNEAVHEAVTFLLVHCPPTLHLMILSRSDPSLPIARLRARGKTVEFRVADLRFTESESFQFLNGVMGMHLDAASVRILEQRTEGWIAGLQMAALSMRDREDVLGSIEKFSGTNRYILDYLLEEVLAHEPEEIQDFLLQTSILTRLSGSLCDAVMDSSGGQEMIERLERRNLFILPLDDNRRWYRYHHLFSDLLQARLHRFSPDRVAQLLSRAAKWCDDDGQATEAVSYALAAQDYELAADLIAKYWYHTARSGEIETVWSWLDALPADTVKKNTLLGIAYCWILWLRGQLGSMEIHLVDAEHAWDELRASPGFDQDNFVYAQIPAELAALRAFVARYQDDVETAHAFAKRALNLAPANLPPANKAVLHLSLASTYDALGRFKQAADAYTETIRLGRLGESATTVSITYILNGVLRILGCLRAAETASREALEYMQANGMSRYPAVGVLHVAMSEVLFEQNNLDVAEFHLAQGLELGKWSGRLDAARNAVYVRARMMQARSDFEGALAAVQEAEAAHGELTSALAKADLLALKATIFSRRGDLSEAGQCIEKARDLVGRDHGQIRQRVALAKSRIMLAQCQPDEAVSELTQSINDAESEGLFGIVLELRILRGLALVRQGATREAEADLEWALAFAKSEGYVRIFLDQGQPMRTLISRWLTHASTGPLKDYAASLLVQFNDEPHDTISVPSKASLDSALIEPLTPRELDVLRLLAEGLTNRQIAAKLVLSEGTVKFYMHTVLRKLGVESRTQALLIAKQQNLL